MPSKKEQKEAKNLAAVLEKIPKMFGDEAAAGFRLHEIILEAAPELKPRLWYGMPGYAKATSKPVLLFIRKDKYLTFGMDEKANITLDADASDKLMPHSWFIAELDAATEARIAEIVRAAVA